MAGQPAVAPREQQQQQQQQLLPGWQRCVDEEGAVFYADEEGRVMVTPPCVEETPEGVDALERFEVVDGERYYWSDGRRGVKGRRDARLLVPGWRRCVRGGEALFLHRDGRLVRRPDYVH